MNLRISKSKLRKTVASVLVPLVLIINQPVAALAAPQPPMPPSVPKFSQTPKSVRIGPKSLKPVAPRALPIHPTDLQLQAARVFEEPLIPMTSPAVAGENDALAAAIQQFKAAKNVENVSALTSFLKSFPKSRWAPAVQLNLGLLRFQSGYMTEALQLWKAAWSTTKNEKGQPQKAIADRCVAEILVLDAKVGRKAEIEELLKEVKDRAFQGSVEQRVRGASDALVQMRLHPEKSYKCGPHAVSALLTIKKGKFEFNKTIDDYPSTEQGTSLRQNVELAEKVGLKLQIAKRSPGAAIVVPSIVHWKLGHFAAVTAKSGDRYEIKDPTFGTESPFKITKQVFDVESDGYALIPAGPLPAGWQAVSQQEGAKVFGKGVPWIWPDGKGWFRFSGPTGGPPTRCETKGMMVFDIIPTTTDLHLTDTPLSYSCPIGGTVGFEVQYQYLQADQPSVYTFTNFGPDWSFQYLSYLTLDVSSTATVRLPQGYSEVYALSGGVYTRDKLSQALLVNMGGGVYQRQLPDGSIQEYSLSDGASPAKIFMTKVIDPQGNETLIQFDADFRITTITDPIGEVSNLSYVSNTFGNSGFYKVSQISDPFSRTCSFSYDSSNTNLMMTTDVIGLQSKMSYDTTNTFVTSLETPYGITSFFKYTPTPSYNARGLKVKYSDGTSSVVETWIGHEPLDATFIWDREAMELYPDDVDNHDFTHAHKTAWLWGPVDGYLWPIVDYIKPALANRIEYSYVDEGTSSGGRGTVGTNTTNKPIKISQVAATPVKATIGGTKTTSDVLTLTFTDASLPGGSQNVAYTVQSADTLATIASGLATAVNANANLKKLGLTAAATGTNIALISQSSNLTAYSKSLSGGATETISLATASPQTAQVTLTGSATSGNYVILGINVNGVSPGYVQYNVQPGDNLAAVATGLKNQINGSSLFTNQGVSAVSFGSSIFLTTSTTANSVSYGTAFSGAPSMTIDYQVSSGSITSVYQYNALGHRTLSVDPVGRVFSYTYAGNGIDLTQITEIQNNDSFMIGNWTYNSDHRPTQYIDGSARTWGYTYNSAGQITSMTDPNSNTTSLTYTGTSSAFLTQINGPLAGNNDITTFSYDGFNRLDTTTDSEGYQLSFDYDSADRRTQTTYPDATTEQTVYDRLDAIFTKDRIGRWSQSGYDSLDQLVFEIDPLGRKTDYDWCHCGSLAKLTDPAGNVTRWHHDLQGRKIEKVYADQTSVKYAYEPGAGRMLSRTDALNQLTNYFINADGTTFATGYQNAVNPTSSVINQYDNKFSRISSVQNDWGTISYSYNAYVTSTGSTPTTGGGRLSTVQNDVIANSDITYTYDVLGRTTNRSIDGANNSITWAYDAMSRVTSEQNSLGTFNYTYVDDTHGSSKGVTRLASVAYPNSQTTNYDWYGNTGDQRLKTINNLNPSGGTLSRFDYQYNPAGEILQWQQQQNGGNDFHNFKYDLAGQLVSDQVGSGAPHAPFSKEFYYAYDKAANRVGVQSHSVDTLRVSGTVTSSDVLTVTVKDTALAGGQQAVNYAVQGGDTLATIAQGIATAINTNSNLQAIGVAANAQSGKNFVNIRAASGNITSYSTSTSGGATEVLSLGIWRNGLENAIIGGTKTTGDVITLTFKDAALSGGSRNVAYTVQSGDTLTSIATNIAAAINADTPLQNLGVSATSVGTTISIVSNSVNVTSYSSSLSGGATETVALSINQNSLKTATIGGTKTTGDTITVNVYNSALGGGTQAVTYTVLSGDTLSTIASGVASAINGNGNLQAIGVSASASGKVVTIQSKSANLTTYRATTSSSATETITLSVPMDAWTVAAIGGSKTTGDVLTVTTYDAGLSGGKKAVNYTVQSGDTLTSMATNLAAAINADADLQSIGVSATSNSTVVSLKSTSPNLTTFAQSVSAGATATIALSASTSVIQSTCNNVNELVSIAPGGKTRFQGSTSKPVVSASVAGQVLTISQRALKGVAFSTSVSGTPTETLTLSSNVNGNITATVGGTVTPGDVLSITVNDIRFRYGPVTCSYTVKTGDTTATIAQGLSNAIYNTLGYGGTLYTSIALYFPSYAGSVVTINPDKYYADVTYSKSVTGVPTETLTSSANFNGNSTVTVAGTVTTGDVVSLTVENVNLSGGEETVFYTVAGGNTTTDIATGLKNAINASSNLAAIGVTSTSSAAVVTIATAGTTYTTSTSGGATETLTLGTNANGNTTLVVAGKATNGDTVTVVTHNPLLPGGQESVGYTVGASDTLVDVAAGLATNMNANSDLQGLGVTAKNGDAADLAFSQSFSGNGTLPAGASLAKVSATDAVPTTKTDTNSLKVTASASSTLTWDANGNMTSDGTNTYKWDAENRLIEIDYPGVNNYSQFSYDGLSRNTKIVETVSGSVTSTRQFVVIGIRNLEERDAGGTIARKFFSLGQLNGASNRYYTVNAQGSTSQMTDNASVITASYAYSPFGIASRTSGSESSDYQYSGYFAHERSSLNLATFRLYSAQNGRWLSRDPIFETGLMHIAQPGIAQIDMNTLNGASAKVLNLKRSQFGLGATNLYLYVLNNPVGLIDPLGLGEGDATFCQALCSAIATGGIAACLLCGVPFWVCMALAAAGSVGCIFVCERIFGPDSGVAGKEPDCPCPSR
ncbi:MAG TPA: LysM peptidoglycan-binding domain-containing protein [Candidatus Melainabacteria bacterium]|nr:LysM peptidoglycan-binding domain-containing protein [Candidatus Melainabacteria bacterium]